MNTTFGRIGIYGVGLIGGSLGLALRERGLARAVHGIGRNPDRLRAAANRGAVDTWSLGTDAIPDDLEILVLAAHLSVYGKILAGLRPSLSADMIVTDVGSAQADTAREVDRHLPDGAPFVGAHPMAGGERTGVEAARDDLFDGAVCALCPSGRTTPRALERVREMWEAVGCRTVTLDPVRHDLLVAWTSHLPHLASAALVRTVGEFAETDPHAADFLGTGFRDTTRIAAGDPGMWRDICLSNRANLKACLARLRAEIDAYLATLESEDASAIQEMLDAARRSRHDLVGDD